jgi:hypothetical protein
MIDSGAGNVLGGVTGSLVPEASNRASEVAVRKTLDVGQNPERNGSCQAGRQGSVSSELTMDGDICPARLWFRPPLNRYEAFCHPKNPSICVYTAASLLPHGLCLDNRACRSHCHGDGGWAARDDSWWGSKLCTVLYILATNLHEAPRHPRHDMTCSSAGWIRHYYYNCCQLAQHMMMNGMVWMYA